MKNGKLGVLMRMLRLVRPLSGFMALAVIMGSLGFLTAQAIPILGACGIARGIGFSVPVSLRTIYICLIVFALARALFRLGEQRMNHYIAFTLLALIRDRVFKALRRLCPAKLDGHDKGDLISLITSDVELLEVFYAHTVSPICIALAVEIIMCVFIGSFHFSMGILALAAYITVGVLLPAFISGRSGALGDELRAQSGELAAHMLESIRGLDETLQYGAGDGRLREIQEKTDALSERQGLLSRLTGTNMALANTVILLFDMAMMLLCLYLHTSGRLEFSGLLIVLIAFMSSFGPVTALSSLGTTLQSTIASGARVLAIIDEEPETEDISGKSEISFSGASCSDLKFSYGGDMILNGLTLSFPQNRIVGIVGRSGSGKSTLLKLFMRFWKAREGSLSISSRNIEDINTADLRRLESYMTQETQLFKDSIANNIRIAKLDATRQEIEDACVKASLHDFIMTLPEGYDTELGELGDTLSGGEKQRIGLARAFLHDAPFMLLDEPTSSLDSLNEAIVLKALKEASGNKTVALVSHRPSTMRVADETLCMDSGRLS